MTRRDRTLEPTRGRPAWPAAAALLFLATGCIDSPTFDEATVFDDNFVNANFSPYNCAADPNALTVDFLVKHAGTASIKITVPTIGQYAGGAIVATAPRNLSRYNALTFWAKADHPLAQFDTIGLADDNTGNSKYSSATANLRIREGWSKYALPIPLPGRLTSEAGLLKFAAAAQRGAGYHIWLDDVRFEQLPTEPSDCASSPDCVAIGTPVPHVSTNSFLNQVVGAPIFSINVQKVFAPPPTPCFAASVFVGYSDTVDFPVTTWVDGALATSTLTESIPPLLLTFESSNPEVALVDWSGLVTAVGCGVPYRAEDGCTSSATVPTVIRAKLGTVEAAERPVVSVAVAPFPGGPPPAPVSPAANVLSILSSTYRPVVSLGAGGNTNSFGTDWSNGGYQTDGSGGPRLTQLHVGGDAVNKYAQLGFVGIDFSAPAIDASGMGFLHLDVWTPGASSLQLELVDIAPDASKHIGIVTVSPPPAPKTWVAIDLPLSRFAAAGSGTTCGDPANPTAPCLTTRAHLSQLVLLSDGTATLYVDNLYFHK
jgi:hypothetical protein